MASAGERLPLVRVGEPHSVWGPRWSLCTPASSRLKRTELVREGMLAILMWGSWRAPWHCGPWSGSSRSGEWPGLSREPSSRLQPAALPCLLFLPEAGLRKPPWVEDVPVQSMLPAETVLQKPLDVACDIHFMGGTCCGAEPPSLRWGQKLHSSTAHHKESSHSKGTLVTRNSDSLLVQGR